MSSDIKEFNDKIKYYINECLKENKIVEYNEEVLFLTEGKVKAIYNRLLKEKVKQKDPENLLELLRDLKQNCEAVAAINIKKTPREDEDIEEYTKNAIKDYYYSKQNILIRSYMLGCALSLLREKYPKNWDATLQEFLKAHNLKLKSSTDKNLRKFYRDIGPYRKLLYVKKPYTTLKRLLPKIREALELYPQEKEAWKLIQQEDDSQSKEAQSIN